MPSGKSLLRAAGTWAALVGLFAPQALAMDQFARYARYGEDPWWNLIELNANAVLQSSGGSSFSGGFSWSPGWNFLPDWAIRGDFGFQFVKGDPSQTQGPQVQGFSFAPVASYEGFVAYEGLMPVIFQLGLGGQTWIASGTGFVTSAQVAFKFPRAIPKLPGMVPHFDRIYVSYDFSPYPAPFISHEFRLGVGFGI
ncbi:MAG: hypothetical protein ACXWP5_00615 [Bdellovibrionota bacterium]